MKRFLALPVAVLALALARPGAAAEPDAKGVQFFETKIRPALVAHCYSCHSAGAQAAKKLKDGLRLDTRAAVLEGGDSGPAVVPGKPKESLLVKGLHFGDDLRMPPKGKLPADVIADFEAWVAMGAPDPRDGAAAAVKKGVDVEAGRKAWAFQPLRPTAPPAVKTPGWARTSVDRYILAGLEAKGLAPAPAVDREKLIRRAAFDLTGLPPTPAEIDAFVNDPAADAYDRLVDRLLASPHYGERWARHWLDVARFAESGGYEFDGDRPGAHHYRDWVIKALNADQPYDEFVRLQLAGDLLRPGDFLAATATGFVVAGPFPGQITAKTRERIRYDHLDDMVATAGSALLGLSLGCARCHDHKYDPIPQADYYRLVACLGRTDSARSKLDPDPAATQAARAAFDQAHAPLAAALAKYEKETLPGPFAAWAAAEQKKPAPAWLILDPVSAKGKTDLKKLDDGSLLAAGKAEPNETTTLVAHTHQAGIAALRLEVLTDPSLPKTGPGRGPDGALTVGEVTLAAAPLADSNKRTPVKLKVVPGSLAGPAGKDHVATIEIDGPLGSAGGTVLTLTLKSPKDAPGRLRVAITTVRPAPAGGPAQPQAGREVLALAPQGALTDANRPAVSRWFQAFDPALRKLHDAVDAHRRQAPQPKLVDAFVAADGNRDKVHFLTRGEVERKGAPAAPGFMQVLMTAPEKDARWAKTDAPRLGLARWITDPENGAGHLLARVMVNRLWQHHLGRGLVATPNDFGQQGEPPTHPELLDHLAAELIKGGWRLKPLHKLIVTSAVYTQGVTAGDAALKADPQNRLWGRRSPRRLEAEVIRDALLAVSGTLDPTMFGPGTLDENRPRRSIYLTVKRSQLVPFLQMFDAPEAIQSVGVRSATTVPPQALALLNSPFARQRAEQLARRVKPASPGQTADAIEAAYRTALGRRPTDAERQRLAAFLSGPDPDVALTDACQLLLCLNEFIYVD